MDLESRMKHAIRDVPDFPKPGIIFKDITTVLSDPQLCIDISRALYDYWATKRIDGVVGIESRGFFFGMQLAQLLNVPFIPVRKVGKLPYATVSHKYELEYGSAEIELHTDAIKPNSRILVHDDLLATGGTADAAAALIMKCNGVVAGYSFLVALDFLNGRNILIKRTSDIQSLVHY
ncbi:MAG: adenine phosphoribosyltransferase [Cyclobacteriaceae bacterium]